MGNRLSVALSSTALVVAVMGTTSAGQAAVHRAAKTIVPGFAKTAGYATTAGQAENAAKLNGHASSTTGAPGTIPVVGRNGKLPAGIVTQVSGAQGAAGAAGAAGAKGATGAKGPTGPIGLSGISGYQIVTQTFTDSVSNSTTTGSRTVSCPQGKKLLGGGASITTVGGSYSSDRMILSSYPDDDDTWRMTYNKAGASIGYTISWYAICANVTT